MVILIADDNRLNRFTLKSMLEEILTGEDTILEAYNGKEMIAVCKEKTPDIVFADIKMPYVNGIDAIAECKKYNLDIVFVVVSGYSDFEVAQRAMQLDVQDYLLKPVNEEKLRMVMEKLQKKLEEEKEKRNSRFKLELFHAFNDFRVLGKMTEYEEKNYGEDFRYEVISVKSRYFGKNQKYYVQFQDDIVQKMELLGKKLMKIKSYYTYVYSDEGTIFFIFYTTQSGRKEIHSFIKKLAKEIHVPDVAFHFNSFSRKTLWEVYEETRQVDSKKGMEINFPNGAFLDLDSVSIPDETMRILRHLSRVIDVWECQDALAYKEIVYDLYNQCQEREIEINMEAVSQYFGKTGLNVRGDSLKAFCQSLLDSFPLVFGDTKNEADVVGLVKNYIEKNYMNDIGVAHVAEIFDLTPNYLSSIFRQKTGEKFTEYLTKVRIEHAKQLLIQKKSESINNIAAMTGYSRPGYFTMVFQKITGLKPSEYRRKYTAL